MENEATLDVQLEYMEELEDAVRESSNNKHTAIQTNGANIEEARKIYIALDVFRGRAEQTQSSLEIVRDELSQVYEEISALRKRKTLPDLG